MRIGEGENESVWRILVSITFVPRLRRVSTKKIIVLCCTYEGYRWSFVVAILVEICCLKPVSKLYVSIVFKVRIKNTLRLCRGARISCLEAMYEFLVSDLL